MGYAQANKSHFSFQEWMELEKVSEIKHEFFKNEVFAMAGTTRNHNILTGNIYTFFRARFIPKGCGVFSESLKLEVIRNEYYPYPDILLTCNDLDKNDPYIIRYPSLIVEVSSKSTAEHDRIFKWQRYQKMPSLQYYLLVSQYEVLVELFSRIHDSDTWNYRLFEKLEDEIAFPSFDLTISVSVIYENIVFAPATVEGE